MSVMRWVGTLIGVLGMSAFVTVARAEPRGVQADMPVGTAAFPADATSVAQVHAPAAPAMPPSSAAPLVSPPAPPAPVPAVSPVPGPAIVVQPVVPCTESTSVVELGAAALAAMIRDGKGLFAVLGVFDDSSDAKMIDDAAEREVRRLRLMHQLAATREQESEREFTEALTVYLRKRAFLEGLEARRQAAPGPFTLPAR